MRNKFSYALLGVFMLVGGLSQAQAALVYTFSDASSDATPASDLDATLTFAVNGSGDTLTLTLENQTTAPNAFAINEVYFNFDSGHGGFNILSGTGTLTHGANLATQADGFGQFDIKLDDFSVASGGTATWDIGLGLSGVTDSQFADVSTNGFLAALKFVQGPDDPEAPGFEDSAFGAVVPVPAAVWLFGSGLLGLIGIARRKQA